MGVSNNFLDKGFSANLVSFGVRVFSRVSLALPQPLSPPFSTKNPPIFTGGGGVFIKTQKKTKKNKNFTVWLHNNV